MSRKKKQLLLDDDEGGEQQQLVHQQHSAGAEQQQQGPIIRVNEAFARRFEHNKRREELHRLQEKHPRLAARLTAKQLVGGGEDDGDAEETESSSDDDTEEEELAADDTDKVLETLVRIKRQDPVLKQPDVVLFPEGSSDDDEDAAAGQQQGKGKRERPMFLRTVLAKQALEGAEAGASSDDEQDDRLPRQPMPHSYAAEQQELKAAFLQAAADAEQGGDGEAAAAAAAAGVLRKRQKRTGGDSSAAAAAGADGGGLGQDKEQQVNQLLDEYFGKGDDLDPAGAFLKSYIANKAWKEQQERGGSRAPKRQIKGLDGGSSSSSDDEGDSSGSGSGSDGGADGGSRAAVDDEEDEQFLEEVDRFEAAYNFRYEEPGAARIQSFPRVIADSVRRPDERRKRQRESKAERKAVEREAREAEIRRLKNLKKGEIQDMFARIQKEAGIKEAAADEGINDVDGDGHPAGLANLLDELLEGDFDPEAYDKRMAAAFDDAYYEGDDERDELFGDHEEELAPEADVLTPAAEAALGQDGEAAGGGFAALHKQLQQGVGPDEQAAAAASAMAEERSQLQRKLEEYYKLDCEDNIDGIPCRFKYRQVPAETFGLSVEDILTLPDKDLNQIIGMKRVAAPYQDDGRRLRPNYKALQRIKGEAAAAAAARHHKKQQRREKTKQRPSSRQQGEEQQQQHGEEGGSGSGGHKRQQQQQLAGHKRRHFEHGGSKQPWQQQQQQQQHKHSKPHHSRQQKPVTEMTNEEKQAARLASYAKLTLKPARQDHQDGGGTGGQHKKQQQQQDGQQQQRGKKRSRGEADQAPAQAPVGRLSSVQVDAAQLTKAQKKNLLRALKRKEKRGGEAAA